MPAPPVPQPSTPSTPPSTALSTLRTLCVGAAALFFVLAMCSVHPVLIGLGLLALALASWAPPWLARLTWAGIAVYFGIYAVAYASGRLALMAAIPALFAVMPYRLDGAAQRWARRAARVGGDVGAK